MGSMTRLGAVALALAGTGCALIRSAQQLSSTYEEVSRGGQRGDPLTEPAFAVPAARPQPRFSAGAAVADLTPPPGFPTGGHGPAGDVARGRWLRMRARAFFFEDRSGRAAALVSADLFAVPAGLQLRAARRAGELLAARGLDVALPPEALVLAATHTHHGPGNYLTARAYNQFGSSYPGFQPELLDFLAERIAQAVVEAAAQARARPAPVELAVHVQRLGHDLLRNRAPWSFVLNRERDALLAELDAGDPAPACTPAPGEPADLWDLPGCPRLRAADRGLTVLEVVQVQGGQRSTVAALAFLAVHPTVLPAPTPFYGSDLAGYAMQAVEARLGAGAVVGFFNGAEGDVTARRARRDLREAAAFGERLAAAVGGALQAAPDRVLVDPEVAVRGRAWRPADEGDRTCGAGPAAAILAPVPRMGAPALGGAEDDRTPLYALGWRDGVRDRATDQQGVKLPGLDSRILRGLRLTDQFAPAEAFPDALPLALVSLGDLALAAAPAELTTAQGLELRHRLGLPHGKLELVGLANEYASYCASEDEYMAQGYEGASTLWGPAQGHWLACRAGELWAAPPASTRQVAARTFWPGTTPFLSFGRAFTAAMPRPDAGLEEVLRDRAGLPERRLPWFAWEEAAAAAPEYGQAAAQRVAIRVADAGAWRELESDAGPGFLTMYLGDDRWSALWLAPLLRDGVQGTYSFAVTAGGVTRCSRSFAVGPAVPLPDQVSEAASCADPP